MEQSPYVSLHSLYLFQVLEVDFEYAPFDTAVSKLAQAHAHAWELAQPQKTGSLSTEELHMDGSHQREKQSSQLGQTHPQASTVSESSTSSSSVAVVPSSGASQFTHSVVHALTGAESPRGDSSARICLYGPASILDHDMADNNEYFLGMGHISTTVSPASVGLSTGPTRVSYDRSNGSTLASPAETQEGKSVRLLGSSTSVCVGEYVSSTAKKALADDSSRSPDQSRFNELSVPSLQPPAIDSTGKPTVPINPRTLKKRSFKSHDYGADYKLDVSDIQGDTELACPAVQYLRPGHVCSIPFKRKAGETDTAFASRIKRHLNVHSRDSTEEAPWHCEEVNCGHKFLFNKSLDSHTKKLHTEEYICHINPACPTFCHALHTQHMLIFRGHQLYESNIASTSDGIMRLVCPKCKVGFWSVEEYETHVLYHATGHRLDGEPRHTCPQCDQRFWSENLYSTYFPPFQHSYIASGSSRGMALLPCNIQGNRLLVY